jgi:hypothetical protein
VVGKLTNVLKFVKLKDGADKGRFVEEMGILMVKESNKELFLSSFSIKSTVPQFGSSHHLSPSHVLWNIILEGGIRPEEFTEK